MCIYLLKCTWARSKGIGSITILWIKERQKTAFKSELEYYTAYNIHNNNKLSNNDKFYCTGNNESFHAYIIVYQSVLVSDIVYNTCCDSESIICILISQLRACNILDRYDIL